MESTEVVERVSAAMAERLSRRSFVRKSADRVFGVGALLAAGKLASSMGSRISNTCDAAGPGCPYGCGPSQCCNWSGRSSGCKCGTGTSCTSGTTHCRGRTGTTCFGVDCWTCQYVKCLPSGNVQFTTTCCDCRTSGCNDGGICISYKTTSKVIGPCGGRPAKVPVGTVLAIDTGDPRTSSGDASMFYRPSNAQRKALR